jgi:hypothetical protein
MRPLSESQRLNITPSRANTHIHLPDRLWGPPSTLLKWVPVIGMASVRLRLKCDGTRGETRFRFSAKRTSPFKSAGVSVQSTTGSRRVRISGSNAGYTMFRGSVKGTGCPLQPPVSPSLPLQCVTVCHHVSIALYQLAQIQRHVSAYHKRKHVAVFVPVGNTVYTQ